MSSKLIEHSLSLAHEEFSPKEGDGQEEELIDLALNGDGQQLNFSDLENLAFGRVLTRAQARNIIQNE